MIQRLYLTHSRYQEFFMHRVNQVPGRWRTAGGKHARKLRAKNFGNGANATGRERTVKRQNRNSHRLSISSIISKSKLRTGSKLPGPEILRVQVPFLLTADPVINSPSRTCSLRNFVEGNENAHAS